jgi:hypothetical protein
LRSVLVQILAGIQTVVTEVSHVFQLLITLPSDAVVFVELLLDLTFSYLRLVRHDRCPLLSHRNSTLQEYKLFTMIYTLLDTVTHCHCWLYDTLSLSITF